MSFQAKRASVEDNRRSFSLGSPFLEQFCFPSDSAWATSVRFSVFSQQRQGLKMLAGGELHFLVVMLIEASSNILVCSKAEHKLGTVLSLVPFPKDSTACEQDRF